MRKELKRAALRLAKGLGCFAAIARSAFSLTGPESNARGVVTSRHVFNSLSMYILTGTSGFTGTSGISRPLL